MTEQEIKQALKDWEELQRRKEEIKKRAKR